MRVLLVDDDSGPAPGLEAFLDDSPTGPLVLVGRTGDRRQAPEFVRRLRPDVAVVDGGEGDRSALLEALRRARPTLRVLVVLGRVEAEGATALLRAGAHGVLARRCAPEQLVASVRSLASGHLVVPRQVLVSLLGSSPPRQSEVPDGLTSEDRELWRMVADGLETIQIAEKLFVSERTVKRLVASLLRRLGVANRIQAAALAGQAGLLDDLRLPAEPGP